MFLKIDFALGMQNARAALVEAGLGRGTDQIAGEQRAVVFDEPV
jgi:hypothetical protein